MYKTILERVLGIPIGGCYLVHFDYTDKSSNFTVYDCLNLKDKCGIELDKLIKEVKYEQQNV
jgi:hypothetical protein